MLYKVIYDIINKYLNNIQIIDKTTFKYRCSQCRQLFLLTPSHKLYHPFNGENIISKIYCIYGFKIHMDLKECTDQPITPWRIYCIDCINFFDKWILHNYKEFK
jgi:hypothetical protein